MLINLRHIAFTSEKGVFYSRYNNVIMPLFVDSVFKYRLETSCCLSSRILWNIKRNNILSRILEKENKYKHTNWETKSYIKCHTNYLDLLNLTNSIKDYFESVKDF